MTVKPDPIKTSIGPTPGPWRALKRHWRPLQPPFSEHLVPGDDGTRPGGGTKVTPECLVHVTPNGWFDAGELAAVVEEQARLGELGDGRPEARRAAWIAAGGLEKEARAREAEQRRLERLREAGDYVWTVRRSPHRSGFQCPYGSARTVPPGGTVGVDDLVGREIVDEKARRARARDEATRHIYTYLVPSFCAPREEALAKVRELNLSRDDWRQALRRYEVWAEEREGNDKYLLALEEVDFPVPPYGTWEDFDRERKQYA